MWLIGMMPSVKVKSYWNTILGTSGHESSMLIRLTRYDLLLVLYSNLRSRWNHSNQSQQRVIANKEKQNKVSNEPLLPDTTQLEMSKLVGIYGSYSVVTFLEYSELPSVLWRCWLGGRKGIRPVKNLSGGVLAWLSVWSEMQTCIWPSWCHCHSLSLASVKFTLVSPFWYRLTWVVPEKGPLNGCVCVCVTRWAEHGEYITNIKYMPLSVCYKCQCENVLNDLISRKILKRATRSLQQSEVTSYLTLAINTVSDKIFFRHFPNRCKILRDFQGVQIFQTGGNSA